MAKSLSIHWSLRLCQSSKSQIFTQPAPSDLSHRRLRARNRLGARACCHIGLNSHNSRFALTAARARLHAHHMNEDEQTSLYWSLCRLTRASLASLSLRPPSRSEQGGGAGAPVYFSLLRKTNQRCRSRPKQTFTLLLSRFKRNL